MGWTHPQPDDLARWTRAGADGWTWEVVLTTCGASRPTSWDEAITTEVTGR